MIIGRRGVLIAVLVVVGIGILLNVLIRRAPPPLWIESSDGFEFREWKPCLEAAATRYASRGVEVGSYAAAYACMDEKASDLSRMYGSDLKYARQTIADRLAKDVAILINQHTHL
jgi:hypothetical protein